MIYTIISNIGLAIMMIIVYGRYSKSKIAHATEAADLNKKINEEIGAKKIAEERLVGQAKDSSKKIETLLGEVDELRKAKESEFSLRLEAEKQIELALLKIEELQKRMKDWRLIQDGVMRDYKDSIIKIGNDLFKKLNDSYKNETQASVEVLESGLFEKLSGNIEQFFEKTLDQKLAQHLQDQIQAQTQVQAQIKVLDSEKKSVIETSKTKNPASRVISESAKKVIDSLVATMKAAGQIENKNYFLPNNFSEKKANLLLCEVIFVSLRRLYIVDLKACSYFEEYNKNSDKLKAENVLKQKLDKYLTYLTNPKYRDLILKMADSKKIEFDDSEIVIVLASKEDLKFVTDINYQEKLHASQINIMSADELNNLVL